MIDTNNSKIGNPFPFRVFCQKVIPLAFDESMSYLELLYSLLHYLKETVIPAVNNNADAVTELQNLYNELKSYVDNYFENLDIQTEINNKLDEMAESGQLAEIISLYLDYNLLQCYNTNEELKQSTSLNNGSFARTYGKLTYNDGYGAFYKIRLRTNQDEPDDDNLIVLVNTENLIAEKMKNQYLIDTKNNLQNEINKLKNKRIVCIGDSYNKANGWGVKLQSITELSNNDFYSYGESAGGFVKTGNNGFTFQTLLENNINNIANKDTISHIIVCGGTNDALSIEYTNNLENAMNNFITYCNTQFPNAKIFIGFVGGNARKSNDDYANRERMYNNNVFIYATRQRKKNVVFMNGLENIMKNKNMYENDYIHPNTEGVNAIAGGINNFINGGCYDMKYGNNTYIPLNNTSDTLQIQQWFSNDVVESMRPNPSSIHFNNPVTPDSRILSLTNIHTLANWKTFSMFITFAFKTTTNNSWVNTQGKLYVSAQGQLQIHFNLPDNSNPSNITDLYIYEFNHISRTIDNPFLM